MLTTHAARAGADALGFDYPGMLAVVMALTPSDFYKSMTTHADYAIWQDVYRPSTSVDLISHEVQQAHLVSLTG